MVHRARSRIAVIALAVLGTTLAGAPGARGAAVKGRALATWISSQDLELQLRLESVVLESEGYLVTGPLDPRVTVEPETDAWFRAVRIVCPNLDALRRAQEAVSAMREVTATDDFVDRPRPGGIPGARGVVVHLRPEEGTGKRIVVIVTLDELRWMVWLRDAVLAPATDTTSDAFRRYASAVSDYLHACDRAEGTELRVPEPPRAASFSLPGAVDLYPEAPAAVFTGQDAYRSYLQRHAEVHTTFAHAILGFVPTDSLVSVLERRVPAEAWPDREEAILQQRYRTFFEREGDPRTLRTLTAGVLAQLRPGDYSFAVGLSGKIRFAPLPSPAEVAAAEQQSGHKAARPSPAFLFPGEPVFTAGVMTVEAGGGHGRIARVSTASPPYFYSTVSPTAREDIAVRSDRYLLTLGYLFRSLDRLGIAYQGVLVTKM